MSREVEEWAPVVQEAQRAFSLFQILFKNLADNDQRWTELAINNDQSVKTIHAQYNDDSKASKTGVGYQVVKMDAGIGATNTTGHLTLTGSEHWEFEKAEVVGTKVADMITPILEQSGLRGTSQIKLKTGGRNSFWFTMWKLWPHNHPKFKDK